MDNNIINGSNVSTQALLQCTPNPAQNVALTFALLTKPKADKTFSIIVTYNIIVCNNNMLGLLATFRHLI